MTLYEKARKAAWDAARNGPPPLRNATPATVNRIADAVSGVWLDEIMRTMAKIEAGARHPHSMTNHHSTGMRQARAMLLRGVEDDIVKRAAGNTDNAVGL